MNLDDQLNSYSISNWSWRLFFFVNFWGDRHIWLKTTISTRLITLYNPSSTIHPPVFDLHLQLPKAPKWKCQKKRDGNVFTMCKDVLFSELKKCELANATMAYWCLSLQHATALLLDQKAQMIMTAWKKSLHHLVWWPSRWIHNKCHLRWEARIKCQDVPGLEKRYLWSFNYVMFVPCWEYSHTVAQNDRDTVWLALCFCHH